MTSILRGFRRLWLSAKQRIAPRTKKIKAVDRRAVVAEISTEIRKAHTQKHNSNPEGTFVIQLSTEGLNYLEEFILREEQEIKIKDFLQSLPS